MKKIIMIACLAAVGSHGMDYPRESDIASSDKTMYVVQNTDSSDDESMYSAKDGSGSPEPMYDGQLVKSLSRTVTVDITNPEIYREQSIAEICCSDEAEENISEIVSIVDLDINNLQNIEAVFYNDVAEENISKTSLFPYKKYPFWAVVEKVIRPLQIVTSASTIMLITASEMVRNAYPLVSIGLSYGALGSAVTSGILSLFITKMNSGQSNKLNEAKVPAESISIDVERI